MFVPSATSVNKHTNYITMFTTSLEAKFQQLQDEVLYAIGVI